MTTLSDDILQEITHAQVFYKKYKAKLRKIETLADIKGFNSEGHQGWTFSQYMQSEYCDFTDTEAIVEVLIAFMGENQ